MSEDTPSLPYTDEECADMIQCYLISGKKLELTRMCYANKYCMRRKPDLHTLKIVVQKYLDSLVSNNTPNPGVNFTVCSKKDESILDYFTENSHATVAKAASIFCVQTSYIDQLLKKRKANTVLKGKEVESTGRKKRKVKVLSKKAATKTKQEKSETEQQLIINKNESDFKESNIETVIIIEKIESSEMFCREDINETHDADTSIYSEASTSNMIDNYLGESTKNESQDVGNCSQTAKSETDDEFICREIEYTKKRNKNYSKRSGTKKPKPSEDVISETPDNAFYSEATTSTTTDNLLREITLNVSQDVGNCSETAKSQTDDEVMCREIQYTKKHNEKYSKRSGTKNTKSSEDIICKTPIVAVYSEATTNRATDNLLREITMNASQDVGICSETAKSERDDEVICREIEYTKKRNKKYSKRSGTKKPKSSEDIISEIPDDAVYSEATTSTTTDNLLREITKNELQNVGNCSETAKSETDDEVICREIDYTKKRNKKYSKRSGTKKPNSSKDIMSETQDVAVHSEATTSTTTDNLLREITMNESQDVGNCSETAKSQTDDEVMCREIQYTKNHNEKYSKRSGTKNTKSSEDIICKTPVVALYSEATTSTATDNLLREITMNASQDVGNCSETAKSERDDEVICREIEYTKKRNKKYSKRSGTKKPKSSEDIISEIPDDAVYSEATTSTTTDNLLREITKNELQNVANCSETAKSETDDEVICREIDYTKKRNKNYSKRSGTKKPKPAEDVISETPDNAFYSEATTSTTTDNLLREITMNASQDVGNCSETAKSERDDEVICREIEYTKKLNKKYSKRSITKKPKSSEDIISEIPDDAVYSEATTSTTTDNLLREITKNELQNVANFSETAKSETDDEVICREIDYTKKRNKKYSKRSGTKKPKSSKDITSETQDVAVHSEATTSTTTDNLLREVTRNESQDVGNYSETRKSETEDDVICCEMEYTKKRKKKYIRSSGSKKPKKNKKRKRSRRQEPKTLEFLRMVNVMVYTTRLEEMAILHKKINHLDNAIIMNDILRESKPKYNYWEHKSNINVKRTMSFKLLKTILIKLKKNVEVVDLTDNDDLIITDVIYPANIVTLNAEDTKGRSNKSDVVIVINNLFSNLRDIYVTNWKCDLIEYHCTNLNDKCDLNKFDKTKIRLILDACCWIKRHRKVESIWPRNECKFFRFLIAIHKCPPDQCNCCCKTKESTTDVTLYKPSDINVFTKDFKSKSCDKNKNLILNALRYKKPDTNKNIKTHYNLQNVNIMHNIIYLFREISRVGYCSFSKSECFEIGSNQDIVRFHTENYFRDPRQKCYECFNITSSRLIKTHHSIVEIVVCCKWKLISILNEQYKACKISANTLKFLKGMVSRKQNVCNCCKQLLSVCDSLPKTKQISNLIVNIPKVEHTRKLVKPTLLKIDKTSSRILNNVNQVAQQILQETKYYAHKDSAIQTTKIPSTSTVKLIVTCNQIPGLDFELDNVNNQLATMIVAKFSNMKFTVKEDLKVVASLNNPIQTTSTEEFKIIARILLHTQKCLKLVPLPPGSDIGLVAKIVIPSDLENNNNRDSFFGPFKKVNKGTVTVGGGNSNIIVKPTELAIVKVLQAFTPFNITEPATKEIFHGRSNTDFIKNENEKFGADDSIEVTDDSCSYQNYAHKLNTEEQPSTKIPRRNNQTTYFDEVDKTKGRGENSSENKIQVHDVVCLNFSSDHFGSDISDINYDEAYTKKLKPYDGLANVMRCSKKCYAESFRSFLNEQKKHLETEAIEVEKNIVLPKISSVFSLQSSAQQTQKETNESVPSTSKADNASNNVNTETTVPTTSNNENTNVNLLNAGTPFIAGQQLMLYDPVKKNTHVVCLTPNGLLVPVANPLNTINPSIEENILSRDPITIPENNSNVAVLTPIIVNQICDGNMTFIPAMQNIQENSILPDILNDIPKNIDLREGENNVIVVKQETKDDFVVLDSD